MGFVALLLIVVAVSAGAYFLWGAFQKRRTPPELRGDWWTAFERDFRAYASAKRHRRGERGSAGR